MNSRERILTTLRHKEPDRVPIDLGGMRSTGISVKAHERLKQYLGLRGGELAIYDVFQQLTRPDERILRRFGADVYAIIPKSPKGWKLEIKEDKDGYSFVDEWGIGYRMAKGGWCYYMVEHPLKFAVTWQDLGNYNWPNPHDPGIVEGLDEEVKDLYENTDYALLINSSTGGLLEHSQALRGFDTFLMDMVVNPEFAAALLDKVLEFQIEFWGGLLAVVGKWVQVVQVGDDLGAQDRPYFSLDLYRKFIHPRHKQLYQFIKGQTDAYLFLHSCGSVYQFIADFIEEGVEILNPVQVSAKDMDTRRLKSEFGDVLTFWGGGCDTQWVLPFGRPEDVRAEVKRRIDDLAAGGGFVFSQVHNIAAEVPPENIVAMYEAVLEFGKY